VARIPQLGRRGGGWVVLQFVLIALVVAAGVIGPAWPATASALRVAAGIALALAGALLGVLSARALGASLTPYPHPAREASFVAHGPYRLVRHPIYFSGLLFLTGVSLLLSPWGLAVTALLGMLWALKSSVEERFLREHYPEYDDYCERTRHRLVPFVY
jgi:protein-S-isoprenylcysteine O-methyltransferase Ste14